MKSLIIAIDGPAGAGKSTVAQILAQRLNYTYIDSGAMYRAIAWQAIMNGLDGSNVQEIGTLANNIDMKLEYVNGKTEVIVGGKDITAEIRTPEVSRMVAAVATIPAVRNAMVQLQREMAEHGSVVMDGRDIGTYVLPNADVKIFLTASIDERAKRRWRELTDKGFTLDLNQLQNEIACRDKTDCEREMAPLIKAADAVLVDTTELSIDGAVQEILRICEERTSVV